MSERPDWMPSEEDLSQAIYAYAGCGDSTKMEKVHRNLWLRAQIAVLERVASMSVPLIHPDDPTRYIVSGVQKAAILDEIAALRKELGE